MRLSVQDCVVPRIEMLIRQNVRRTLFSIHRRSAAGLLGADGFGQ
jgi:hypothetical protein